MMYYKCTKNSYWYTKIIQTVRNLYKHQPEMSLKIAMYFFCNTYFVQTMQNLYNYLTETAALYFLYMQNLKKLHKIYTTVQQKLSLYIFCVYKICTNYTKSIQLTTILDWNAALLFFVYAHNVQTTCLHEC